MAIDDFSKFRLDIIVKSLILGIIVVAAAAILGYGYFSLGYIVGLLVSLSAFSNMYSAIRNIPNISANRIKLYLSFRYILSYIVLGFVMVVSYLKDISMFAGVVVGFLSLKAVIYIDTFINKKGVKSV